MFFYTIALLFLASIGSFACAQNVGEATYFDPGNGACGHYNTDADSIVAVSEQIYSSSVCNKQIQITYQGKTVYATVTDECPGCAQYDLDMSPAVFNQLADPSVGRLYGVQWSYT